MGILDSGLEKWALIFVLGIVILGPAKMIELAAAAGRIIGEIQRASAELSSALNAELAAAQENRSAAPAPQEPEAAVAELIEAEAGPVVPVEPLPAAYARADFDFSPVETDGPAAPASAAATEPAPVPPAPVAFAAIAGGAPQPARPADGLEPLPEALLEPSSSGATVSDRRG